MLCAIRGIENSQGGLPMISVTLESGVICFFTIEGQRVGGLADRTGAWKLTSSTSDSQANGYVAAARVLRETQTLRRATDTPQRRQLQEKRDWIRHASTPTTSINDAIAEVNANQRPGLSRFLAVAKQL
jgi:hypothetical protein